MSSKNNKKDKKKLINKFIKNRKQIKKQLPNKLPSDQIFKEISILSKKLPELIDKKDRLIKQNSDGFNQAKSSNIDSNIKSSNISSNIKSSNIDSNIKSSNVESNIKSTKIKSSTIKSTKIKSNTIKSTNQSTIKSTNLKTIKKLSKPTLASKSLELDSNVLSIFSKEDHLSNKKAIKQNLKLIKSESKSNQISLKDEDPIKPTKQIDKNLIKQIKEKLKESKAQLKTIKKLSKPPLKKDKKLRKPIKKYKEPKFIDENNLKTQKLSCRICFSSKCTSKTGDLIIPCNCRGIFSTVHHQCIADWILSMCSNTCDICRFKFLIKAKHKNLIDFIREQNQFKFIIRFLLIILLSFYLILIVSSLIQLIEHYRLFEDKFIFIFKLLFSFLIFFLLCFLGYYVIEHFLNYRKWRKLNYHIKVKPNPNYKINELITPPPDIIRSSGLGQYSVKPIIRSIL